MARSVPSSTRPVADPDRQRRIELQRLLAARGLVAGPRRVLEPSRPEREDRIRRLREALREAGPLFVAFGRYLSTRADLLRAPECLILAELPDRAEAESPEVVHARIESELGRPLSALFDSFVDEPLHSGLVEQTHRAVLRDGPEITLTVVRSGDEADWNRDLPLLDLLGPALESDSPGFGEAVADFRRCFTAALDCRRRAEALVALAREAEGAELLAVPRVFERATAARVLATERLPGTPLAALTGEPGGVEQASRRRRAARRLSHVWLQTALGSRCLAVAFEALELDGDARIALIGGSFSTLPDASRRNLWNYLRAAAAHYPERAGEYLRKELTPAGERATTRELQLRMRQAMPFRDGGWSDSADTMAEHLLLHWRIARECGFRIPAYLTDFYRGVFAVARLGRRLDPAGDPLTEGLEGVNWLAGWSELRHLTAPMKLGQSMNDAVLSLSGLPQRLERVLRAVERDAGTASSGPRRRAALRRAWNSSTAVAALLTSMAALTILATRVAWPATAWVERGAAVLFLALGVAALVVAWRDPA